MATLVIGTLVLGHVNHFLRAINNDPAFSIRTPVPWCDCTNRFFTNSRSKTSQYLDTSTGH